MSNPVFEVAVYTVTAEKIQDFISQQPIAHQVLRGFKGFKSLRSLRSIESPNTFVDYCEWESHEDAVNANTQAMITPELKMFFELGDGVISFGHYSTALTTSGYSE